MSAEDKDRLYELGYRVRANALGYWAISPEGFSILRGPALTEDDAWDACLRHFNNSK